jgi:hypothetical protein
MGLPKRADQKAATTKNSNSKPTSKLRWQIIRFVLYSKIIGLKI